MYAHNVLGYTNGMHPNLSKVTMHLNPFWTNYPTHLYKPLIGANGKQKSAGNLNVCVHACGLVCICARTVRSLNAGLSGCTRSSIGSCRYKQWDAINFTYTCLAYFFTFFFFWAGGGNCNWNEWLVRPNNGHRKPPRMQKRLSANALAQRWCINFSVCACRSIPEKLGERKQPIVSNSCTFSALKKLLPKQKKKEENLRAQWFLTWTKCC